MRSHPSSVLSPQRLAVAVSLAVCAMGAQAVLPAGAPLKPEAVRTTDQIIIKYRGAEASAKMMAGAAETLPSLQLAHAAAERYGVTMTPLRSAAGGALVAKLNRRLTEAEVAGIAREIAQSDSEVLYAEPDRMKQVALTPNDTQFASQWHYTNVAGGGNFASAWDITSGTGVVVAVLDTGYRSHADLRANLVTGYDFISDSEVANDGNGRDSSALDPGDWTTGQCGEASHSSWHGTHVAGTVAAVTNNSLGVAGAAYGAKVQPVRVLGTCGGYDSDIADAIIWASGGTVSGVPANATPARVINLSLGGSGPCASYMQSAINSARSRNTVVVVAAGNSAADTVNFSPANCTGVISVAAVGRTGAMSYYSNYGPKVQIAAPGGDQSLGESEGVLSTANSGLQGPAADAYRFYQGTSMATPHVAAAAALMISRNPALTPNQVASRLRVSAKVFPAAGGCSPLQCGAGILDAYRSVYAATVPIIGETPNPNDSIATAQLLAQANVSVSGKISTSTDKDYYKIALPAGKLLVLSLAMSDPSKDFDLELVNAAGTRLALSQRAKGETDRVTYTNTGASTMNVYARVYPFASSTGDYTLMVRR